MTTPTPAAVRAAESLLKSTYGAFRRPVPTHAVNDVALVIDDATGLPELLAALRSARRFAVNAINANVDLPGFNPADHQLVKEIDAVLVRHEANPAGTKNPA